MNGKPCAALTILRVILYDPRHRNEAKYGRELINHQGPHVAPGDAAESGSLKERSVRSGAITLVDQALSHGVHLVSVVILARLLTPEDYGVVAMVTAVTGFLSLFKDLGLSSATIQCHDITSDQLSALFWVNAGLGALITLIIAALGPVLAWFYHKPQLSLVTVGISLTSLLSSLGTQHSALLTRQMRFGVLAVIRVSSLLAGFLAAAAVALSGGTYWALVASAVVTTLSNTCGLWLVSGFRPGRPRRGTGVRPLVRFGAHIAAFDVVNYFHRNLDNVLIGRAWGAQQLGLYSKAYALLMLPISNLRYPLGRVALPALSRLQNEPGPFRDYFLKYCSFLAFASMPIVAFLYACSENVIRLILGPRWLGAAELFSILALVSFIQPVTGLPGTVLVTLGRGGRYFRWGLYNAIVTVISFFCGLPWGAKGVAIGYCIATYAILHPSLMYALHGTPLRPADFYRSLLKPCLASIAMCLAVLFARGRFHGASDAFVLALLLPLSGLVYLGVFCLFPGGRRTLLDYGKYVSILWGKSGRRDGGSI
jgi:PST family polysaccharide transporter